MGRLYFIQRAPGHPIVNLTTVKLYLNDIISINGGGGKVYDTIDIKYFYLGTPLTEYEYTCILLSTPHPPQIIDQYNLSTINHNGYAMIKIRNGVYMLLQAGIVTNM